MTWELRPKLAKALLHLRDVPRALRLAWDAAPTWTALSVALLLIQGILPVATVWLSRSLVNSLVAALRAGHDSPNVHNAVVAAILLGLAALADEALRALSSWVRTNQGELVQDRAEEGRLRLGDPEEAAEEAAVEQLFSSTGSLSLDTTRKRRNG